MHTQSWLFVGLLGLASAAPADTTKSTTTSSASSSSSSVNLASSGDPYPEPTAFGTVSVSTSKFTYTSTSKTPTAPPSEVTANATPIPSSNSYWWIDGSCAARKNDDGVKYWDFIETAYNDAKAIAKNAYDWPTHYTEASDLYFGKNFHKSQYAANVSANIKAIGEWQTEGIEWPFTSYVRVSCADDDGKATRGDCNQKIGKDTRSIGGFANNTKGTFGSLYSSITLCPPFWTLNTMSDVKKFFDHNKPDDLQMIFMETSGEKFFHEATHCKMLTNPRPHIIDQIFDTGKRIYGPRDVAKAARIATQEQDFSKNAFNADSYSVFAQAAYWQEWYGVVPPPLKDGKTAPQGAKEASMIFDSQDDYFVEDPEVSSATPTPTSTTSAAPKPTTSTAPKPGAYATGVCGLHLKEKDDWEGANTPGFQQTHTFGVNVTGKDANNVAFLYSGSDWQTAGDGKPYILKGYDQDIAITPEASGGNYIQFTKGSESWTTKDTGTPGCSVGAWDGSVGSLPPQYRDMDCSFHC